MSVDSDARTGRYALRAACTKCPFRADVEPYLRPERAQEIAAHLRDGGEFACHKTTVPTDDGDLRDDTTTSQVCAGALATMEREGNANQMMRISERLGLYDPTRLVESVPVHKSLTAWVQAHQDIPTVATESGEVLPYEHCGVVWDDCEDPAGYRGGYGTYENDDEPTCNPLTDTCWACGHAACAACRSEEWDETDGQYCVVCYEPED